MPLQDSHKKRNTTSQAFKAPDQVPLTQPPTPEDLKFSLQKAQHDIGRPIILSWKQGDDTYLLTVTLSAGANDPTWILHVGHEEDSAIVWIYTTSDVQMIHGMLSSIGRADMPQKQIIDHVILETAQTDEEEDQQPLPHEEFADRYELLSRLGHGGMGIIYKAKQRQTEEVVALKVLHSHLLNDMESKKRFEQEAAACRDLKHRNIIQMLEFGFSKHGQPYMTMEYLEGRPLTDLIEKKGRLEVRKFINIFTQICDALNHAHQKGVVHRDVKPSNIMIMRSDAGLDIAKILDFGIAKRHVEENRDNLTPTGNVLGSPAYIAPEQCAGAEADPRSDIYSLGCVMYEALTGTPPFVHDSAIKVLLMQLSETPQPLCIMVPDAEIPMELETIIMRCLEKDPNARYQNATELGADLWTFAATGQRGIIPDPVAEGSEAPLAKEAAAAGNMMNKLDSSRSRAHQAAPPGLPPIPAMSKSGWNPTPKLHTPPAPTVDEDGWGSGIPARVSVPPPPPLPIQAAQAAQAAAQAANAQAQAEAVPVKRCMAVRFKRFRSPFEMEVLWEGLSLARNLQRREIDIIVVLELESVCLALKPEVVASRFNLEPPMVKKLTNMQAILSALIKDGATVVAAERWAKRGNEDLQQMLGGIKVVNDDELTDIIIECSGSILDY